MKRAREIQSRRGALRARRRSFSWRQNARRNVQRLRLLVQRHMQRTKRFADAFHDIAAAGNRAGKEVARLGLTIDPDLDTILGP